MISTPAACNCLWFLAHTRYFHSCFVFTDLVPSARVYKTSAQSLRLVAGDTDYKMSSCYSQPGIGASFLCMSISVFPSHFYNYLFTCQFLLLDYEVLEIRGCSLFTNASRYVFNLVANTIQVSVERTHEANSQILECSLL